VLFDLLHRWEDADAIDPTLLPGEQTALWSLSATLERALREPFSTDHRELVAAARARLLVRGGA
jgi:hypothetical protein